MSCLQCFSSSFPGPFDTYRWVPLKLDFLGARKSDQLKHYPAYPIIILSLIIQRNMATKIRAKRESGLTAVRLKRDPPVMPKTLGGHDLSHYFDLYSKFDWYICSFRYVNKQLNKGVSQCSCGHHTVCKHD